MALIMHCIRTGSWDALHLAKMNCIILRLKYLGVEPVHAELPVALP